jgi:hypothetical protein
LILWGCIGTDIVEDVIVPERVSIGDAVNRLRVGDSFMFSAEYFDDIGQPTSAPIVWSSTNSAVVSITPQGLATANIAGTVFIKAQFASASDSIEVEAGNVTSLVTRERNGTFQGLNNYTVNGGFSLAVVGDDLELTFNDEFQASNGPGLFVYLTNNPSSVAGGIEVSALVRNSGRQRYIITGATQLNTYDFVLIYCKPFGVPFGRGTFNN